jgi:hypothetical protein
MSPTQWGRVRDTKVDVTGNHKLDSSQGHAATEAVKELTPHTSEKSESTR